MVSTDLEAKGLNFKSYKWTIFGSLVLIRIQTNINEAEKGKSPR